MLEIESSHCRPRSDTSILYLIHPPKRECAPRNKLHCFCYQLAFHDPELHKVYRSTSERHGECNTNDRPNHLERNCRYTFSACGGLTSSQLFTRPDWCEIHGSRQTCRPARILVELCVVSFITHCVSGRRGTRCGELSQPCNLRRQR